MDKIEAMQERLRDCIRSRANHSMGDPETIERCHRASEDLDRLVELARAAKEDA